MFRLKASLEPSGSGAFAAGRRRFLLRLGAAGVGYASTSLLWRGLVWGAKAESEEIVTLGSKDAIYFVKISSQTFRKVPLGFQPHGFSAHPRGGTRVWTVEKRGTHALELDVKQAKVVRELKCPPELLFYGHCAFQPSGERLVVTAFHRESGAGHVVGYDPRSGNVVFNHEIAPGIVHDCAFLDESTMLVTSLGMKILGEKGLLYYTEKPVEKSSLLSVHVPSGRILGRHTVEDGSQIAGHFLLDRKKSAVLLTMPWANNVMNDSETQGPGSIYVCSREGKLQKVELGDAVERQLKGGFISVAQGPGDLVAATNPGGKKLLLIDAGTRTLRTIMDADATGIGFLSDGGGAICEGMSMFQVAKNFDALKSVPLFDAASRALRFGGAHLLIVHV